MVGLSEAGLLGMPLWGRSFRHGHFICTSFRGMHFKGRSFRICFSEVDISGIPFQGGPFIAKNFQGMSIRVDLSGHAFWVIGHPE